MNYFRKVIMLKNTHYPISNGLIGDKKQIVNFFWTSKIGNFSTKMSR